MDSIPFDFADRLCTSSNRDVLTAICSLDAPLWESLGNVHSENRRDFDVVIRPRGTFYKALFKNGVLHSEQLNVRFDHIRHFMICVEWMVPEEYKLPLEQYETVHINALEPLLKYLSMFVHGGGRFWCTDHMCQKILVANGTTPLCTNLCLYYNSSASLMLFERQNMNKLVFCKLEFWDADISTHLWTLIESPVLKMLTCTGTGHGFTVAMMHRRIDRHLDVTAKFLIRIDCDWTIDVIQNYRPDLQEQPGYFLNKNGHSLHCFISRLGNCIVMSYFPRICARPKAARI
ncbi:hypothetical protein L596_014803 [Steinernema carpocapsae]|uniref:Uncharacterized protein n=1 Tax=Steinernema carpocapsae TaxID=34508 RepID=A0A4V6A2V7_STECR|nr:hypothetical protein L596_014803 [Steinernema carpocapsae]